MAAEPKESEQENALAVSDTSIVLSTASANDSAIVETESKTPAAQEKEQNKTVDQLVDAEEEEDNTAIDEPPLLIYHRLPKHGSVACTSAMGGQVILNAQSVVEDPSTETGTGGGAGGVGTTNATVVPYQHFRGKPISIFLAGYANGSIQLKETLTGTIIHEFNLAKQPIVQVAMDATGTILAAIDQGGNCHVWTVGYRVTYQQSNAQTTATKKSSIASFFWRSSTTAAANSQAASSNAQISPTSQEVESIGEPSSPASVGMTGKVPMISVAESKTNIIFYSKRDFGVPTTLSLDPNYRRTNKLIAGFDTGKLVLTAPNWMFRFEHISIPYQGAPINDADWRGIECSTWRGSLLAFADCSGVKLYDVSNLKPVAHVDRPVGVAHAEIPVSPSLVFETPHSLLVAWGDCLMNLVVTDHMQSTAASVVPATVGPTASTATTPPEPPRRRTVSCRMAWALDCQAAGVAPVDDCHVAILGHADADLMEFEIIDRRNGMSVWSDLVSLQKTPKSSSSSLLQSMSMTTSKEKTETASMCTLLSSFIVPKLEEGMELVEYQRKLGEAYQDWDIQRVNYDVTIPEQAMDDTNSVDSDDYGFLLRNEETPRDPNISPPPFFILMTSVDSVLGRMRTPDDAVTYALEHDRIATALRLAILHAPNILLHDMNDLVNLYLNALLAPDRLSLRRMKMAADALPTLLGGQVGLWEHWVAELENIPGAMFVVRTVLPVRDPRLPKELYALFLSKMLEEVEAMRRKNADQFLLEAEGHFLNTLLVWGTSHSLQEHISLYEYQSLAEPAFENMVRLMQNNLTLRATQSAAGYLTLGQQQTQPTTDAMSTVQLPESKTDALYDIDEVIDFISERIAMNAASIHHHDKNLNSRIVLDSVARLYMMNGSFEEALRCFLYLGTLHAAASLDDIETQAVACVNKTHFENKIESRPYSFLLKLIAKHHLHECLLQHNFLPDVLGTSPICSLARLVGLDLMGDFLMEFCTPPQQLTKDATISLYVPPTKSTSDILDRRGTLPLDLVAVQLSGSSKLLHWYLNLVFMRKPELYVKFPNTANLPTVITDLHKRQLDLHIKLAGENRDSAMALAEIEAYRVVETSTPLLDFLRVIVKLGSVSPVEVGKLLEIERRGGAGVSSTFAIELAYIMENFGSKNESDARLILELYLKGAKSLMLAASFAQRTKKHHLVLWEILIDHCLSSKTSDGGIDGRSFGALLEAAALCGADLAKLVARIPPGMQVEGLRPRLVAAVADYRLKVKLHETSTEVAAKEKLLLVKEEAMRSRRGLRVTSIEEHNPVDGKDKIATPKKQGLNTELRTRYRPNRYYHKISIPIR